MSREGYTVDVRCEDCGQSMATRRLIPDGYESYRVEVPPCEHCQKQSTEKAKEKDDENHITRRHQGTER
jgi:hypothetical protein